jgi:hypothetical protein
MPLNFSEKDLAIEGFISDLSLTRSNRKDITLFVNGRWVQDPTLTAAVIKAYNTMLMVGRYPVVVLFLSIPTNLVDVNVHPTKAKCVSESRIRSSAVCSGRSGVGCWLTHPSLILTVSIYGANKHRPTSL